MTLQTPERSLSATPRCDQIIPGGGMMSYHCVLSQGHQELPSDDHEPCYSPDSPSSRTMWSNWKDRQDAKAAAEADVITIECPHCHRMAMKVDVEAQQGTCGNCLVVAEFQSTAPLDSEPLIADPEQALADIYREPEEPEPWQDAMVDQHNAADFLCMYNHDSGATESDAHCFLCNPPAGQADWQVATANKPAPTKTREGDQRLPNKGMACVQDWIIDTMEESKRVGESRYGQSLMTFDARLNIRDLAEELRDAFVYVSKLQMTAEADRSTLVEAVNQQLNIISDQWSPADLTSRKIAESVVNTVLDWVLTQRLGSDQVVHGHEAPLQ